MLPSYCVEPIQKYQYKEINLIYFLLVELCFRFAVVVDDDVVVFVVVVFVVVLLTFVCHYPSLSMIAI